MSNNDSNESSDTAAQAFQVGDRVEAFKSWGGGLGYYQAARVVAVLRTGRYRVRLDVGKTYRIVSADDLRAPEPATSEPATPAPAADALDTHTAYTNHDGTARQSR